MSESDAAVYDCRPAEFATVNAFVTGDHHPSALLIEGAAGIGKSTLWGAAVSSAMTDGRLVLAVRPAESEARMSFASLADLLEPVADTLLPKLEAPQRAVLEVALLRRLPPPVPPNEREIGAAVLAALRQLADQSTVVVAIDDVQWLDDASAEVLAFALRRLRGNNVRLLISARTGEFADRQHSPPPGAGQRVLDAIGELAATRITLGPLTDQGVTELIRTRVGALSPAAERRLVAAAGGNPYWALELGTAIAAAGPTGSAEVPIPASLSGLLRRRLVDQPDQVRLVLVVVAALSRASWAATSRALAGQVTDADAAIDAAVAAGVVTETAGRLRPAHPLLGLAAIDSLAPGQRYRLHRRLAEITADPEQRARHLALANNGEPDSEVARSLSAGALSARSRGATHAAAELVDLSIALTPASEVAELADRRLAAAELWFAAGDLARACELAEELARDDPDAQRLPAILPLLVETSYWIRGQAAAQSIVRTALDRPGGDPRLRAVALACAADVGDGSGTSRAELAGESIALFDSLGDTDPGSLSMALVYLAEDRLDSGTGIAADLFARAQRAEDRQQQLRPQFIPLLNRVRSVRAYQLKLVDDLDGARTELLDLLTLARREGDDGSIPALLGHLALTECWAGNYPTGLAAAQEGLTCAEETGGVAPASLYAARGLLAVLTGDQGYARKLIGDRLGTDSGATPTKKTLVYHHVLGLAELLAGENRAALHHLDQAYAAAQALDIREPGRRQRLEGDLGQALIGIGELDRAAALAAEQREIGERLGRPTLIGVGLRIAGMVQAARGDVAGAVVSLEAAVGAHRLSPLALELPRTQLALGQIQRRRRDKQAARLHLQAAVDEFTRLGAAPWAELAASELRRLGGARSATALTAAEQSVAALASAGRNNREIAAELFISARTVEGHLASVYRKLDIPGRGRIPRQP